MSAPGFSYITALLCLQPSEVTHIGGRSSGFRLKPGMSSEEFGLSSSKVPEQTANRFIVKFVGLADAFIAIVIVDLKIAIRSAPN
jgi:hypothetical protein